jgi:hypothetical protein
MPRKSTEIASKQENNRTTHADRGVQTGLEAKTETKPAYRVEKIGTVAIDTGHVVIVDPCRVDEVLEHFDGPLNVTAQLGQFVVGSQTGLGDGRYPVFAEIINDENFGERVVALHVHLDPMYCFEGDPKVAAEIKKSGAEYLANAHQNEGD